MARRKLQPRKLLVASAGAATLVYLGGCANDAVMTGNLVAPPDVTPPTPSALPTSGEQAAPSGTAPEASAAGSSAPSPTTASTAH